MTVPALTLAAVLILAACEAPEDAPQREPPPEAAQFGASEARFDLASGLAGRAPFTLPAMEAAFPGYQVISRLEDPAAGTPPAFEVHAAGSDDALFVITPDWSRGRVGEVSTTHLGVGGPLGVRAGLTPQSEVIATFGEACAPAGDPAGGAPGCEVSADGARLRLEFAEEGDDPLLNRIVLLANMP